MAEVTCPQCGAPLAAGAGFCKFCGEAIQQQAQPQQQFQQQQYQQQAPQTVYVQQAPNQQGDPDINPYWPIKNKMTAGILGILLGSIGVHKFYLGKGGLGILYILFCWTGIPSIIGIIEGIIYLTQTDRDFQIKNQVKIG